MKDFMKGALDTLRIAFIFGVISYGIFVTLAISTPQPPTSNELDISAYVD